ncbi:MAG: hypothetical protein ACI9MR_001866 [Myxococcota bacterium]|jgi:hypothetical protein
MLADDAPLEPISFMVGFQDANTEFSDDSNGDGYLSPGETATVTVWAKNTGTSEALGVWAKLNVVGPSGGHGDGFGPRRKTTATG